jgi:DNA-binding NtrC family response regulator
MTAMSALPRVLIVDDQLDVAQLLADLLRPAGYETATATNGDEALAQAAAQRPDVVLLDLTMPGRDGIEVMRELHALDGELPAIIVTGHGSADRARAAMRSGAFDFFTKPFDGEKLLASIAEALEGRLAQSRLEVSRA